MQLCGSWPVEQRERNCIDIYETVAESYVDEAENNAEVCENTHYKV